MSRVQLAVQEIPINGTDSDVVYTSGDASNDHYFENTGREIILFKNADSGSHTCTVVSVTDEAGRSGDLTVSAAAGKTASAGPFKPAWWNQRGSSDLGHVFIDGTDYTSCSFAVIRYNQVA